jgi:hypothetical protein
MTTVSNTFAAAVCALLLSTTCVVAAVGPATAVTPTTATQQVA